MLKFAPEPSRDSGKVMVAKGNEDACPEGKRNELP
jgi:hypothetical protein